ncbi:phage head-tail adapter protein, partial [Staphylococcus epidermidis]
FIANCIKQGTTSNISSRTMGTVSYTFVTDLPKETYGYLKPFRRLRWTGYHV